MAQYDEPRVPPEIGGIQFNFCKNPRCLNYARPVSEKRQPRGQTSKSKDSYIVGAHKQKQGGQSQPSATCSLCGGKFIMKSNLAIAEELGRHSGYLSLMISCPKLDCPNHGSAVTHKGKQYYSHGKTNAGARRFRCRLCKTTFSISKPLVRQEDSHLNPILFRLLVNKVPFQRICEICDISFRTLLKKIDFVYRQCVAFVADREQELVNGKQVGKLYIGVDRQDYVINWGKTDDKRNIVLHGVGSADNRTGYVFGIHLDYDHAMNAETTELDAVAVGDYGLRPPFRRYARVFLDQDYSASCSANPGVVGKGKRDLLTKIADEYRTIERREDPVVSDYQDQSTRLPAAGMLVHGEYTVIAHFFFLKRLLAGAEKLRFFLDMDPGMAAGVMSAFPDEVLAKTCDAFLVKINKDLTNNQKLRKRQETLRELEGFREMYPELRDSDLKRMLLAERLNDPAIINSKPWVVHPFPNMDEPEKSTHYLTDLNDRAYDPDHLTNLHHKASLHAIDLFFMLVRRRITLLERPISSSSNKNKRWYGYSAYNPKRIIKLLEILRVYFNYVLPTDIVPDPRKRTRIKAGPTRAQKLGLAKGRIDVKDILYFTQG